MLNDPGYELLPERTLNATQRKTVGITSLVVGITGGSGVALWFFNALATFLRAVNLDALPEAWAIAISSTLLILGGIGGYLSLRGSEPIPALPSEDDEADPMADEVSG